MFIVLIIFLSPCVDRKLIMHEETDSALYHNRNNINILANTPFYFLRSFYEWTGNIGSMNTPQSNNPNLSIQTLNIPPREIKIRTVYDETTTNSDSITVPNPIPEPINPSTVGAECIKIDTDEAAGTLKSHQVNIDFNGRPTIGDLDNDGIPDLVMANRNRIAAYSICGKKLWDISTKTNWDYSRHYFWNYTTYGFIGDADGDLKAEFLHFGNDWRTLFIRDGKTGNIKQTIQLSPGEQWMYVLLAQRAEDTPKSSTRIIVTSASYDTSVNITAIDIRSGSPNIEWTFSREVKDNGMFVYLTPQVANLDGVGGDEIFFGSIALNEHGKLIWLVDANNMTEGRGLCAATVKDLDPSRTGLESVFSLYSPINNYPSLLAYGYTTGNKQLFSTLSPDSQKHPHQHTIGDFDPDSYGLEILVRNNDGFNHWMTNYQGKVIKKDWRIYPGWDNAGEYVQGIEWDHIIGTEILYIERHVPNPINHGQKSKLAIASPISNKILIKQFSGAVVEDPTNWEGVHNQPNFNPYEAMAIVVDLFGDGREEILTWGGSSFTIYYNSGDKNVPKRWGDPQYEKFKKISCPLYSPR
ncbi:MAG: hypothetical protein PHZ02_03985 [Desulfocapsaceae bacterium]|nr:hypothetical protein [Desulfocapsaceae bacterium]